MNILQEIRRTTVFGRALIVLLTFSFLLLPLTSWSSYGHSMQTSSQTSDAMKTSVNISMTDCHHQSKSMDQQGCGKDCCKNIGSNQNCKDCPNSCAPTIFFSLNSDNINRILNSHEAAQSIQSSISSRRIAPAFRPPITLLS